MIANFERAKRDRDAKALPAQFPHLIPTTGDYSNRLTTGAKNIRIELKAAFPRTKFSVRSKSYSMGCSISVHWTDGPTTKQVDAIIDKYEYGTFDGMTDCSGVAFTSWHDAFGGAKHTSSSRSHSADLKRYAIQQIAKHWGIDNPPTVEEHDGYAKLSNDSYVPNANEWLSTLMYRFLQRLAVTATTSEGFFCHHIPRDYDLEYEQREAWPPSAINY